MKQVKKNGKRRGLQTYKCLDCGHKWQNKRRTTRANQILIEKYVWQRQTYNDLAKQQKKSNRWIQTQLDQVPIQAVVPVAPCPVVVVPDTTFFTRTDGLTVFREPNRKVNLWWQHVTHETAAVYQLGRTHLEQHGFTIQAAIVDGKRGVQRVFHDVPVQMCHFHQKQIINRYLTTRPKLEASRELRTIMYMLTNIDKKHFTALLEDWYRKWEYFLKERTIDDVTGKWHYTHKRLRSAYRSLQTNLPYLFTYQDYSELNIPNTTNSLDGYFNRLKSLLNVHRGLSRKRRNRIITKILIGN